MRRWEERPLVTSKPAPRRARMAVTTFALGMPIVLLAVPARADRKTAERPPPDDWPRLALVGLESAPETDPRDTWIPIAFEEVLSERLGRVSGVFVVPTFRIYQARLELRQDDSAVPAWNEVAAALGATHHLTGICRGWAQDLELALTLTPLEAPEQAQSLTIASGRLVDVLDEATRALLAALMVPTLDEATAARLLAPPSESLAALEYYARSLRASRAGDLREALRLAEESTASDRYFRRAHALLGRLEIAAGAGAAAATRYQLLARLARQAGDPLDQARAELGQSLILQAEGNYEVAAARAATALEIAYDLPEPYTQIAAISVLTDLRLTREPPAGAERGTEEAEAFLRTQLDWALQWQQVLVRRLAQLRDRVGALPALSKLALLHERRGESAQALEAYHRIVTLAQTLGSQRHEATGWFYLGQGCFEQERWADALDAFSRSLEVANEAGRPPIRILMGRTYARMHRAEDALREFETACELLRGTDDLANLLTALHQSALAKKELGRRAAAIQTLQEAVDLAHVLELREADSLRDLLSNWQAEGS